MDRETLQGLLNLSRDEALEIASEMEADARVIRQIVDVVWPQPENERPGKTGSPASWETN